MHPHSDREHTSQRPAGHWLRIAVRSKRSKDAIRPYKHTVDHTVHCTSVYTAGDCRKQPGWSGRPGVPDDREPTDLDLGTCSIANTWHSKLRAGTCRLICQPRRGLTKQVTAAGLMKSASGHEVNAAPELDPLDSASASKVLAGLTGWLRAQHPSSPVLADVDSNTTHFSGLGGW